MGRRVQGFEFRVLDLEFKVQGLGCGAVSGFVWLDGERV